VVGGRLDRLDTLGVGELEVGRGTLQLLNRRRGERVERLKRGLRGQRKQPRDLDGDAFADQRVLAEVLLLYCAARIRRGPA
jgi:hypothetical protein